MDQPLIDEIRWLKEEADRYRTMGSVQRVAIFRDLMDCMVAFMGDRLSEASDGELPAALLWYQPALRALHGTDRRTPA